MSVFYISLVFAIPGFLLGVMRVYFPSQQKPQVIRISLILMAVGLILMLLSPEFWARIAH